MRSIILILLFLIFIAGCIKQDDIIEENQIEQLQSEQKEIPERIEEVPERAEEVPEKAAELEPALKEDPGRSEVVTENDSEVKPPIKEESTPKIIHEPTRNPSLIAHWTFDEDAKDYANSNHGTMNGAPGFIVGKIGNAVSFDGVDDYIEFPVTDISTLKKGTIAFWFNYQSILDKQTVMPIFYIGGNEKDSDNIFIIEIGHFNERIYNSGPVLNPNNKKLYVTWIRNNQEPFLCYDSNINLAEDKWHHFAVVVDENGNTGYLNGKELTNRHYNFGNSKNSAFLNNIPDKKKLMLGYGRSSYMVGPDFVFYKGALDDFRIYDRALTSEEIIAVIEG